MKILIIKPSSLGDIVHAIPLVSDLKKHYPDAHISWLVNESFKEIILSIPEVEKVITFDRNNWKNIFSIFSNIKKMIFLISQLKNEHFDVVFDLQGLFRSGFFSWVTRSQKRFGFASAREFSPLFYTHKINVPDDMHAVEKNRKMIQILNPDISPDPAHFSITIPETVQTSLEKKLQEKQIQTPYCLFAPSARWESKKWPADHFVELAELIHEHMHINVVFSGSPFEKNEWVSRVNNLSPHIISLVGETSLLELCALIKNADFVVANDSGAGHLAIMMNTYVFSITGPTNPEKTGPCQKATVIKANLSCSPCYKRICPDKYHLSECLTKISPHNLLTVIKNSNLLNKNIETVIIKNENKS